MVGVATLAFLVSFLDRLGWSGVATTAAHDFGLPVGALTVFTSLFFVGYLVTSLVGGFVVDRVGARRTLVVALVPLGVLTVVFGQLRSVGAAAAVQLLMGLCAGVDFAACMRLLAERFPAVRRAGPTGWLMTASSLGVLLVGAVTAPLAGLGSWAWPFRVFGALTLVVATEGPWPLAIAGYHSQTPELGIPYQQRVLAGLPGWAPLTLPGDAAAPFGAKNGRALASWPPRGTAFAAFAPQDYTFGAFAHSTDLALATLMSGRKRMTISPISRRTTQVAELPFQPRSSARSAR